MAPKGLSTAAALARDYVSYYKAIFARTLFGTHATVAVWRTTVLMGVNYWALLFGVVCLSVEYIVTMWANMGNEWPWISPSTLCYLVTVGSSLWVQKLQNLGHITGTNGSTLATLPSTSMELDFSPADWVLLTEQSMMMTIILSRWLLPKGEMSHTELSTLLLLYLGLSADILDFSSLFNDPKIAADETFSYVILTVWTFSLSQFVLNLTATKKSDKEESITLKSIACSSEVWQILLHIGLNDLPLLVIRLTVMLNYQVFNYTIIFFVCKNLLVICLEVNHMIGLCVEQRAKLKRRLARLRGLKNKLRSAKNTITLAHKSPFDMSRGSRQNAGKNDGETKEQNMLSVAGAAFAERGSEEQSKASKANPESHAGSGHAATAERKLARFGSKLSGVSDDGYATAAEGGSSRIASTESISTNNAKHNLDQSTSTGGQHGTSDVKSTTLKRKELLTNIAKLNPNAGAGKERNVADSGHLVGIETLKVANETKSFKSDNQEATAQPGTKDSLGSSVGEKRQRGRPQKSQLNTIKDALSPHQKNQRRGTPPLGHFMAGSSTFSLSTAGINTTDSSSFKPPEVKDGRRGPFASTVFGKASKDDISSLRF